MAQKQPGQDGPSLELPSLGFGRKRKRGRSTPDQGPDVAATQPPPASQPTASPPPPEPEPSPAPLFVDEVAAEAPEADGDASTTEAPPTPARSRFRMTTIGAVPATLLTGAVVGALLVGLTWGALHLCELIRGTSSCGNPGFFLLLAIAVALVVLGKLLLAAFDVPEPGSTSFLGVGLVAVVALLFLVDVLFHWSMVLVIPAVAMAAYALAHWVTTAFVEVPDDNLHR